MTLKALAVEGNQETPVNSWGLSFENIDYNYSGLIQG